MFNVHDTIARQGILVIPAAPTGLSARAPAREGERRFVCGVKGGIPRAYPNNPQLPKALNEAISLELYRAS